MSHRGPKKTGDRESTLYEKAMSQGGIHLERYGRMQDARARKREREEQFGVPERRKSLREYPAGAKPCLRCNVAPGVRCSREVLDQWASYGVFCYWRTRPAEYVRSAIRNGEVSHA